MYVFSGSSSKDYFYYDTLNEWHHCSTICDPPNRYEKTCLQKCAGKLIKVLQKRHFSKMCGIYKLNNSKMSGPLNEDTDQSWKYDKE